MFRSYLSVIRKRLIRVLTLALVSLLALVLTLLAARPPDVQAAAFTAGTTQELTDAINSANGNTEADTITLTADITLDADLPQITSVITIEGDGHFISGNHARRVLTVASGGNLTLHEVIIQNGTAADNGGGIYNDHGQLSLTACTLSGNVANLGGGINNNFGTVTINGSTVQNNTGNHHGGGIYNIGTLTITDSTLSDNTAANNGGGIRNNYGTVNIITSTLSGNWSKDYGGGAFSNSSMGTVNVTSSTLSGNRATGYHEGGGGFHNDEGIVNLINSTLAGNTTTRTGGGFFSFLGTVRLAGTILDAGSSGANCAGNTYTLTDGGHNLSSDTSCTFTEPSSDGGVVLSLGPLADNGGPTQTHALLSGSPALDLIPQDTMALGANICPATGGADQRGEVRPTPLDGNCDVGAYEVALDCALPITDTPMLSYCITRANVHTGADTLTLGANITLDADLPQITSEITIEGGGHFISGGDTRRVLYIESSGNLTLHEVIVQDGSAAQGAGIYNDGGQLTLTNSTMRDNTATNLGGGILNNTSGTVTVTTSTVSGNSAVHGGGILNVSGTVTLTTSTLSGNSASSYGGGLYNDGTAILIASTLSGNSATDLGGGILNDVGTVQLAGTLLDAGTSGDNCANGGTFTDGGYNLSSDASCAFSAPGSANDAGLSLGPLADNGGPTLTHAPLPTSDALNRIPQDTLALGVNLCPATGGTDQRGEPRPMPTGGLCDAGAYEAVLDCTTISNALVLGYCITEANNAAGADTLTLGADITLDADLPAIESEITIEGDGHFISGNHERRVLTVAFSGNLTLHEVIVQEGAVNSGAGIWNHGGQLTLDASTVRENEATGDGGGIRNDDGGTVTVTGSTLAGNTTTNWGGGIYNANGTVTVTNSTVQNNIAESAGGIYNTNGTMAITSSTLAGNTATSYGGGIFNDINGTMAITSSTLSGNTASDTIGYGGGIFNYYGGTVTITASTLSGNTAREGGGIRSSYAVRLAGTLLEAGTSGTNCYGTLTDAGYNLSSDGLCGFSAPGSVNNAALSLGPLADNGGPTWTHALLPDSAGLDWIPVNTVGAGVNLCPGAGGTDQRGQPRPNPAGSGCDVGAYETGDTVTAPGLKSPKARAITPDTTPKFVWKAVKGAANYQLQVSTDPAFGALVVDVSWAKATYTLPDVDALPYGIYFWRVRVANTGGYPGPWSIAHQLEITIHKAPKNGDFTTDTTPTLRWNKVVGAVRYHIQVSRNDTFTDLVVDDNTQTGTSFTLPTLGYDRYYWQMQVDTGGGYIGNWMPVWTFTVTPTPLGKPTLTGPENKKPVASPTPQFTWEEVTDANRYQIQIDDQSNFKSPLQDAFTDELSYLAEPIPSAGKYYWRVRALHDVDPGSGGEYVGGKWSSTWWFTLPGPMDAPELVTPTNKQIVCTDDVPLEWGIITGITDFQVQVSTSTKFSPLVADTIVTGQTTTITDLADGRYYWRVRPVDGQGVGGTWAKPWSFVVDTVGPLPPVLNAPKDLSATLDTTPAFTWSRVKDANWYHLQISADPEFGTTVVNENTLTSTRYVLPDALSLDYGRYYWQIAAIDGCPWEGNWSLPVSFTVTLHKTPKDGSTTTDTTPTFTWAKSDGVTEYWFQIAGTPDFTGAPLVGPLTTTKYTPAPLLGDGLYYWHVSIDGGATWMPTWTVTVTPGTPGKPKLTAPANKTLTNHDTPTFTWNAAENGTSYQIQIDDDKKFNTPDQDVSGLTELTYTATDLSEGTWYWRVRAFNGVNAPGKWSITWSLTVDLTPPAIPVPIGPSGETRVTNPKLTLSWNPSEGAARYEVQLDTNPAFPLPLLDVGKKTSYKPPTSLAQATYYWRVRAIDKAGNVSLWSDVWVFHLVAGNTIVTTPGEEPILVPAEEPVVEPPPSTPDDGPATPEPPVIVPLPPDEPTDPAAPPDEPTEPAALE